MIAELHNIKRNVACAGAYFVDYPMTIKLGRSSTEKCTFEVYL